MSVYGPDASDEAIAAAAEVYFAVLADPESRAALIAACNANELPVPGDVVVPPGRVETDQAVA